MKKAATSLAILLVLLSISNAFADSFWYKDGKWWIKDLDDKLHQIETLPLEWRPERVNINFPEELMTSKSDLCQLLDGTDISCLGLTPTAGCNLRSTTSKDGKLYYDENGNQGYKDSTIKRKIGANVTVFVHFKFTDIKGDEWLYVTCSDGMTGYFFAKRILIIAID